MSNLIVIDGNLFFNNALRDNLSYNDIGHHQQELSHSESPFRVVIERTNLLENGNEHDRELQINSDAQSQPNYKYNNDHFNNFEIDKSGTEINMNIIDSEKEEKIQELRPKSKNHHNINDYNDELNQFKAKPRIEIVKQGYMKKEMKKSKQWKKRWFVLQSDGKLLCYNNAVSKELMDVFKGNNIHTLMSTIYSKKLDKKTPFGILIRNKSTEWKLLCNNNQDRVEWIKEFENVSGATHTW